MNNVEVFRLILKDTIRADMDLVDVLLRAVVLHTHSISLASGVSLEDVHPSGRPPRDVLAPLTRTHLAELLSSFWTSNDERANAAYWFYQYGSLTPYELFTDVTPDLRERAFAAREAVANHPLTEELIEE